MWTQDVKCAQKCCPHIYECRNLAITYQSYTHSSCANSKNKEHNLWESLNNFAIVSDFKSILLISAEIKFSFACHFGRHSKKKTLFRFHCVSSKNLNEKHFEEEKYLFEFAQLRPIKKKKRPIQQLCSHTKDDLRLTT